MTEHVAKKKSVWFTHKILNELGDVLEQNDIPVAYVHGVPNQMFPALERALKGKAVDDEVTVTLTPGDHQFQFIDPDFSKSFDKEEVPPEFRHIGAEAPFQDEQSGETGMMVVQRIEGDKLIFMKKHPFADQTITYVVTVKAIRDATSEEIKTGHPEVDHPHLK